MNNPQSVRDPRILAEMAEEIDSRGCTALPGALRALVRTERGKATATTLERVSRELVNEQHARAEERTKLRREIDGLRDTVQTMTDAALADARRRGREGR